MQQPRDFQDAELAKATEMAAEIEQQNNVETLAAQEEALCAEERDLAAAEEAFRVSNPEQDAAMNPSDHGRLAELSRWLESEELEDAFDLLIANGFRSLKVRPVVQTRACAMGHEGEGEKNWRSLLLRGQKSWLESDRVEGSKKREEKQERRREK